jgi:hypothetical protein
MVAWWNAYTIVLGTIAERREGSNPFAIIEHSRVEQLVVQESHKLRVLDSSSSSARPLDWG